MHDTIMSLTPSRHFRILIALVLPLLAGCLPYTLYHRADAPVRTAEHDQLACETRALREAPPAIEIDVIPGDIIPGPDICDALGNCRRGPDRVLPDRYIRVDTNEALREKVTRLCMIENGYQRVTLPSCTQTQRQSVTPNITTVLPKLSPNTCVIRHGQQGVQIVPN